MHARTHMLTQTRMMLREFMTHKHTHTHTHSLSLTHTHRVALRGLAQAFSTPHPLMPHHRRLIRAAPEAAEEEKV